MKNELTAHGQKKLARILDKNPTIGQGKLAEELGISQWHARGIVKAFKSAINAKRASFNSPIRRMIWDIETSYNIGKFWRTGTKVRIAHTDIIKERAIICIAWKWEGEEAVHALTWDSKQDDKPMIKAFLREAEKADELVAHNGDGFDVKWFAGRALMHGLEPIPEWKTIDTLKISRKRFNLNSHRLDYLSKITGRKGKLKTNAELWDKIILQKDKAALDYMVEYCKVDVIELERFWLLLKNWSGVKSHAGVHIGNPRWSCPSCGGLHVGRSKTRTSSAGTITHIMKCRSCGHSYRLANRPYKQYAIERRIKDDDQ